MKATSITGAMVAVAGALLLGTSAWALTAAGKCAVGELRAAGRYSACRLKAHARATESGGGTPVFSKCDAKFSAKWGRAEARGKATAFGSDQRPSRPHHDAPTHRHRAQPAALPSAPAPSRSPCSGRRRRQQSAAARPVASKEMGRGNTTPPAGREPTACGAARHRTSRLRREVFLQWTRGDECRAVPSRAPGCDPGIIILPPRRAAALACDPLPPAPL